MGRPVSSSPSTRALVFRAFATTRFTAGSDAPPRTVTDGALKTASELASTPTPTTTTDLPPDFPTIGVRLIAVSLLVLLILLLLAWIFLSRRIAAVFRRHFTHEAPPDLVQRASWMVQHQHQLVQPASSGVGGSNEESGQEEEKLISTFVSKYQSGQTRKTSEGGKQSLTLFTLRDCAGTSREDHAGDIRSRAGSEEEFYTPDGSYRGSAFMIPMATSVSGPMMSAANWPSVNVAATALAPATASIPPIPATAALPTTAATPITLAIPTTRAPSLAILAAEALATAAESDSSDTSTPTDPSPLTSMSVTPTLSRTRLQILSPPVSPTYELRGSATSEPSVDVWLSPQEMSTDERTDEDRACSAAIENTQRRRRAARFSSSPSSPYGTTVHLTSDASVDDWYSPQETASERTDDERMYNAISENLFGRLMSSEATSTSTLGSQFHLVSNESMEVWRSTRTSPGDKSDDDSAQCASSNNVQENREVNRSEDTPCPSEDSGTQESARTRSKSARKALP